jgi:hypothetical protein
MSDGPANTGNDPPRIGQATSAAGWSAALTVPSSGAVSGPTTTVAEHAGDAGGTGTQAAANGAGEAGDEPPTQGPTDKFAVGVKAAASLVVVGFSGAMSFIGLSRAGLTTAMRNQLVAVELMALLLLFAMIAALLQGLPPAAR